MTTAFERLPQLEQERLMRYKKHLKLLRMSMGLTQKEFANKCKLDTTTIANAENNNGAFTTKTWHSVERLAMARVKFRQTTLEYDDAYVTSYILDILIRNTEDYDPEVVKKCEYYAKLIVPALYERTLPLRDCNRQWKKLFVEPYVEKDRTHCYECIYLGKREDGWYCNFGDSSKYGESVTNTDGCKVGETD